MSRAVGWSRGRLAGLLAFTMAVYAVDTMVVQRTGGRLAPRPIALAVLFDLAVVVPLVVWLVALRGSARPWRGLLPVVMVSLAGAALVAPGQGRAVASLVRLALVPLELVVVAVTVRALVGAARMARGEGDLADRLDAALVGVLGEHAAAHLLAAEACALVYALGGGRRAGAERGLRFGSNGARLPALTWGLVLATVVEGAMVHLLLGASHPAAAWVLTGLGAYACLWLVGQDRALAARSSIVTEREVVLRAGLRLSARVARGDVAEARRVVGEAPARSRDHRDVARPAEANVVVRFRRPTALVLAFGLRREVTSVAVCVDEPDAFVRALTPDAAT